MHRLTQFLPSASADQDVWRFCCSRNLPLITCDKDFAFLWSLFGSQSPGIVLLRFSPGDEARVHAHLVECLAKLQGPWTGRIVSINAHGYRIRQK